MRQYQARARARRAVELLAGFATADANGQSRGFEATAVGGSNPPVVGADSVVVTTRSEYEVGASGNLLWVRTMDNFGRDELEYHHGYGFCDKLGVRAYHIKDHLGSVRAVVRGGAVVEWQDYYCYGAVRDGASWHDGRWRYLGAETDNETATLHLNAREYDPLVGFLQPDPLADSPALAAFSPYHYSFNNPFKFEDKTGQIPFAVPIVAGGASEAIGWIVAGIGALWATHQIAENLAEAARAGPVEVVPPETSSGFAGEAHGTSLTQIPSVVADKTAVRTGFPATTRAEPSVTGVPAADPSLTAPSVMAANRGKNHLKSDPAAQGSHTEIKTNSKGANSKGETTRYATWSKNTYTGGFQLEKHVNITGNAHFDKKTRTYIPTPHTQNAKREARPAKPEEIPKRAPK